jgi:hypothetical protein
MKYLIALLIVSIVAAFVGFFWLSDSVAVAQIELSRLSSGSYPGLQNLAARSDLICTLLISSLPLFGTALGIAFKIHKARTGTSSFDSRRLGHSKSEEGEQGGHGDAGEAL